MKPDMWVKTIIPGLFILCASVPAYGIDIQNKKAKTPVMPSTTIAYPENVVKCKKGDYIIRKEATTQWQVYLVEDLVWLSRLLTLNIDGKPELIEEKHTLDSQPAEMDGIYLSLSSFSNRFSSRSKAVTAIKNGKLGEVTKSVYLNISSFPASNSSIYPQ